MSKVECPYCSYNQEINHDDGYGYEEDEIYEQECVSCEKIFVFSTIITFDYEVSKAPCKNDGKHKWKNMSGLPIEHFIGKQICTVCGDKRTMKGE